VRRISAAVPGHLSGPEVAALAASVDRAAPELARRVQQAGVGAAIRKLDPDRLVSGCATIVADMHTRFRKQGFCPMLSVIVTEVVERMQACARPDAPLTRAEVTALHRFMRADVTADLRRHANANATGLRGGGVRWKWFGKPTPGMKETEKPLLPPVPFLVPDADGATPVQALGCLAANAAIATVVGIALLVSAPFVQLYAVGVKAGQERQAKDLAPQLHACQQERDSLLRTDREKRIAQLQAAATEKDNTIASLSSRILKYSEYMKTAMFILWEAKQTALKMLTTAGGPGLAGTYDKETKHLFIRDPNRPQRLRI
jgi:hypothetical protein